MKVLFRRFDGRKEACGEDGNDVKDGKDVKDAEVVKVVKDVPVMIFCFLSQPCGPGYRRKVLF